MRCAHYLPSILLEQGGVTRFVLDCCAILADRGHEITLMTYDAADAPPAWRDKGPGKPALHVLPAPSDAPYRLSRSALAGAERTLRNADVLHLHGPWTTSNLQLGRLARRIKIPFILSTHGMLDDWSMNQGRWKKRLHLALASRQLLERAASVLCTAEAERDQASQWFDASRVRVLPYLIDLEPFNALPPANAPLADRPLRILFLSRLHPKKGVEVLLRACAILRKKNAPFELVIAGSGDSEYIRTLHGLVSTLGIEPQTLFPGFVSGDVRVSMYHDADLFVLPTSQENLGLVLTESLACGTPVVTTRGVDLWQELQQAGAVIVEPSPPALADAIEKLSSDRAALRQLGQRGREWVFDQFDTTKLAARYEQLYSDAITAGV